MRGDDVADLQSRLARLGFDCGRVDGILGPSTARALQEFQSNCGTAADGVCGPDTVRTLTVMSSQTGAGPGIAAVRERDRLRAGLGSVAECRIVVGQYGGLSALTRTLSRELRMRGATVMSLDEPDAVAQATAANHFAADVYLGFESSTEPAASIQFYRVPTFESAGGRSLAELIAEQSWSTSRRLIPRSARHAAADASRDPNAGRPVHRSVRCEWPSMLVQRLRPPSIEAARAMGLTVYLRVYPQACPLGVCNPQLDTFDDNPT